MFKRKLVCMMSSFGLLFAISSNSSAQEVEQKGPEWVVKASYDYYKATQPSDQVDGLRALNRDNYLGVEPGRDVDGSLHGVTFNVGRILSGTEIPSLVSLDLTLRTGELDGSILYHGGKIAQRKHDLEADRNDVDIKAIYQWLGETWQPYVGLGYLYYDKEITDTWPSGDAAYGAPQYVWGGNGTKIGTVNKTLHAVTIGGGLGVALPDLGPFQLNCKGEAYLLYGEGEVMDDREVGITEISDTNLGYTAKATVMINYPFTVSNMSGGAFLDLGYQYQQFDFDEPVSEDEWYGPYARFGVGLVF